jgi:hypothetical protein
MPRSRLTQLSDYRSVLNTKGDIAVGAYAEQQRRRRILLAAFGLGLILAAVGLYYLLRPVELLDLTGKHPCVVLCTNEECQYMGVLYLEIGSTEFPVVCPKCKQRSCHKVWECREPDCRERFLLRGPEPDLRCPACGSLRIGTAEELDSEAGVE